MEKNEVFISLIVATLGRTREVDLLLSSLSGLEDEGFEVIVVDQNEHHELEAVMDRYRDRLALRYFRVSFRSVSRARNYGADHARGSWVGFPDDDCLYGGHSLPELRRTIAEGQWDIIAGGIVDFDNKLMSRTYRKSARVGWHNIVGRVSEPCFFMKKEVFSGLGGFDPSFGPGGCNFAGEGMELGLKAVVAGKKMFFNAALQIYHPSKDGDLSAIDFSTKYKYAYGNGASLVAHKPVLAYYQLSRFLLLLVPKMLWRPKWNKTRVLLYSLLGYYDAVILKKVRQEIISR
ncbi:glycosyltransferase family 2 protein [Arcticibacter sp. MXS-1]|uniref:glycosyltransferase n=1 Tax=Arcticibacter sp. MXS-1 TaxID=3341726 RepID=UPI0035A96B48